jgi:hypothetical protein
VQLLWKRKKPLVVGLFPAIEQVVNVSGAASQEPGEFLNRQQRVISHDCVARGERT